ncbi:MAG: YggS family pyridoxal phosphate-dependent enzyme [Bacteroidales bacterium]|nr:YggS family pyridoxal phosphate-dependent enzyme [Bacteroidales bacterium]
MSITKNLQSVQQNIPPHVRLVAVSKFHPNEAIEEAYKCGQRIFGESRVQELVQKESSLPKDIEWHFIGHLQTNKIKQIVPSVTMIHAIDSERLLSEINLHAQKANRTISCLLQIHIAKEETKFGFSFDDCREFIASNRWQKFENIEIAGLMGMATYTENKIQVRNEFKSLHLFFQELKTTQFKEKNYFCELSMGMSDDYQLAIEEGSTLVRIGSTIFGNRNY